MTFIDRVISQATVGAGGTAETQRKAPFAGVKTALMEGVEHAVNAAANRVYERAVKRAPVRKVFRGGQGGSRAQTIAERSADVPNRIAHVMAYAHRTRKTVSAPLAVRVGTGGRSKLNAFSPEHPGFGSSFYSKVRAEDPFANAREVKFGGSGTPYLAHGTVVRDPTGRKPISETSTGVAKALSGRGRYELEQGNKNGRLGGVYRPRSGAPATLGGRLKRQIGLMPLRHTGGKIQRKVISPTPYAWFVEMGTRHSKAQPYLRPALHMTREEYRKIMVEQLRKSIKAMGKEHREPHGTVQVAAGVKSGKPPVLRKLPKALAGTSIGKRLKKAYG